MKLNITTKLTELERIDVKRTINHIVGSIRYGALSNSIGHVYTCDVIKTVLKVKYTDYCDSNHSDYHMFDYGEKLITELGAIYCRNNDLNEEDSAFCGYIRNPDKHPRTIKWICWLDNQLTNLEV